MEVSIYKWYLENYQKDNNTITSKDIKAKAKEFCTVKNFNASKGWLEKFRKRCNIELIRSKRINKKKLI